MADSRKVCAPGEIIFREGEKGNTMYILIKGCVELRKKVTGGETVLKTVTQVNEFFGEMALIDGRPRSATAIAVEPTLLISIEDAAFDAMVLNNPKFALTIIKTLADRIRSSNVQISELSEVAPRERAARAMADCALRSGEKVFDGGHKIAVEALRTWLNSHAGIALDEFDVHLAQLIKGGLIRYAATSTKTKEHVILSERFMQTNDRRR